MALATADPVRVQLRADTVIARWRPLLHWLLVVPHLVVLLALVGLYGVLTAFAFVTVLATRRIPEGIFDTIVTIHRYHWRVVSYLACLRGGYPPFDLTPAAADPKIDAARVSIERPASLSRGLALVKWALVLPHLVVLAVLQVVSLGAIVVGYAAVVVLGRYPLGLRAFVVGVHRWTLRVTAYASFLTDRYPPFSLEETYAGRVVVPPQVYPVPS